MGKNKEQEVKAPPAPVEEIEIDLGIVEDEPEEVPVEALVEGPPMVANQDVLEGMSAGTILNAVENTFGAAGLRTLRTSVAQKLRLAREKKERAENFSARKANKG